MKIDLIAGARPNFIKISPIIDAIKLVQSKGENIEYRLVHTGQHYDKNMSGSFFEQLEIPLPDINLEAGGGTQAKQTAKIMIGYESLLLEETPDFCLVVGDVTSTSLESGLLILGIFEARKVFDNIPIKIAKIQLDNFIYFSLNLFLILSGKIFFIDTPEIIAIIMRVPNEREKLLTNC